MHVFVFLAVTTTSATQIELFDFASVMATIVEAHGDIEGLIYDALDYFACLSLHDALQVG